VHQTLAKIRNSAQNSPLSEVIEISNFACGLSFTLKIVDLYLRLDNIIINDITAKTQIVEK